MAESVQKGTADLGRFDYASVFAGLERYPAEATGAPFVEHLLSVWRAAYMLMTPHEVDTFGVRHGSCQYMFDDYATLEAT